MSQSSRWLAVQICGYSLVVFGLWGIFGISNGFSFETGLIYPSDISHGINGFLYFDPLRKFTSLFYHLSYVLGAAVGERGSFVPYQLMYGLLWVLRAILTSLVVQRLVPDRPLLAACAGLFAALDASDAALNWIGQLNQFGFIFLMLLSFYFLLVSLESKRSFEAACWATASALAGYTSLWSYESPLPVMLVFPIAVAILRRDIGITRLLSVSALYLVPVFVFIKDNAQRYLESSQGALTYEASVTRHSFSVGPLLSDLWLHLQNSVAFWQWPYAYFRNDRLWDYGLAFVPVMAGILLVVPNAVSAENRCVRPFRLDLQLAIFVCISLGLLVASHLVILLLSDNRNLWRTEFLPSFAAACLVGAGLYALLAIARSTAIRVILGAAVFVAVGTFSTYAGVNSDVHFHTLWERQRVLIASIISNAPRVADGTLFVVRDIDRQRDPFGHNMWLDLALRLAYPGTRVAGIYLFSDQHAAPGMNIDIENGRPHLLTGGMPTLFHWPPNAGVGHIVVFDYDPMNGQAVSVRAGPISVGNGKIPATDYDFCAAVIGLTPDPVAVRRYGPIAATNPGNCRTQAQR